MISLHPTGQSPVAGSAGGGGAGQAEGDPHPLHHARPLRRLHLQVNIESRDTIFSLSLFPRFICGRSYFC